MSEPTRTWADEEPLLKEQDVAPILGVAVSTLRKWRLRGEGPPWIKLTATKTGPVRYDPKDVRAYLKQRLVSGNGQPVN